jgi:hypothetical protein
MSRAILSRVSSPPVGNFEHKKNEQQHSTIKVEVELNYSRPISITGSRPPEDHKVHL